MTDEQRLKLSLAHIGQGLGRKLSDETKIKISLSQKGKTIPLEQRLKTSLTLKGRKMPYVSKANQFRIYSDETRKLRRDVAKRNWSNPVYRNKMLSMNVSGDKHPAYIKDRSNVVTYDDRRQDILYKEWVKKVKARDNWTCKINNSTCKGKLEAHHIVSWKDSKELRYVLTNGITLCQTHHPHWREHCVEQVDLFKKLIK